MSRSGYSDDIDNWALIRYRGRVASATRGRRGQKFFSDLVKALDDMPVKALIAHEIVADGQVCAMGALAASRSVSMADVDPENNDVIANRLDIATCLAQETAYMNDDFYYTITPEGRWRRMREWAQSQIKPNGEDVQK